jgi:hypothetical protein
MSLAHLHNRRAPVSGLPDEVLSLIFEAGPRDDPVDDIFYKKSAYGHPLPFAVLVSHISRAWRDVAIWSPFLWTMIRIIHSRSNYLCFMYVDRSQPCSLDVHFTCDVERAHHDFDSSILQLQRCCHLTISCHWYRSAFHIFRHLVEDAAPRLLSLKIDARDAKDGCEDYFTRSSRNLFGRGAPLLSSVELCGISLQLCKPPLGALTRLKLHIDAMAAEMSFDEFRESFTVMATTLTHLEVEGIIFRMLEGEGSPIEFLSLTSLDIRYPYYITGDDDDGDYISHLCDCIHAPALKSLSLFYLNGE